MKFGINNPAFLQMAGQAGKGVDYFYIRSLADGNDITFANTKLGAFADSLEYSLDGYSWEYLSRDEVITLDNGDTIFFRNPNKTVYNLAMGTNVIKTSDEYEVGGDIIKLFYPGVELLALAFKEAFENDEFLISAANLKLPATALAESCYSHMFYGCTGLTAAPELPATALAEGCYGYMFSVCTSLTAAPELPATALAEGCYEGMFYKCTGLTAAPELPATALAEGCYESMFYKCTGLTEITCLASSGIEDATSDWLGNVAPSGTFTKAADMEDWPEGASGIPSGWTVQDYVG